MADRLRDATSPYLRSHAGNPVDWWPWGPEPFAEAARRDIPVLVSIGYATCHWCHVMARESFSDPELASWLNERFVAIKVDREEHPEVDAAYLAAASAFTPNLGWPLTVFVSPEGRAFFAGTYFPPQPVQGVPSFRQVLEAVQDAWANRRDEVESSAARLVEALTAQPSSGETNTPAGADSSGETSTPEGAGGAWAGRTVAAAIAGLAAIEDTAHGGFGGAPKFPVAPVLRFLLERDEPLGLRTLDAIAASPLRDAVDGGFFRYATRADWSEPHYERMLVDNAQLLACAAIAGRAELAEGVAAFLRGTLARPDGALRTAQDSESVVEGRRVEGFYYSLDAASRARLEPPAIDDKVLTGANGLAIEALALAGRLCDRPEWIEAARRAARVVLDEHAAGGELARSSVDGRVSPARPALDDYGLLAIGLLELALATGEPEWAVHARGLVDACLAAGDPVGLPGGGDPVLAHQGLVLPPEPSDGAQPSGPSTIALAALRLHELTGEGRYREAAERIAASVADAAAAQPISFGAALRAIDALARPSREVVVVGGGMLADLARRESRGLVATVDADGARSWADAGFGLFEGRAEVPAPTAFVCWNGVCRLPVTDPEALREQLAAAR